MEKYRLSSQSLSTQILFEIQMKSKHLQDYIMGFTFYQSDQDKRSTKRNVINFLGSKKA
jgi:hypothetical protein